MKNVLCMKWGEKYDAIYVDTLYAMVARNITPPFRFVCLTDDPGAIRPEVECRPLPAIELGPAKPWAGWRKYSTFSPELHDLEGHILFIDLDVVIVGNIDAFFEHPGRFCIIENWSQAGQGIGNSSVYRWKSGDYLDFFEHFCTHADQIVPQYRNSQTYLSRTIKDLTWWPETWCRSFKRHCLPGGLLNLVLPPKIPEAVKIVAFHGDPKPPDAARGVWPGRPWFRRARAAPWIGNHWRAEVALP
jgi:hypothetical protein